MPRLNSTNWSVADNVSSSRLQDFNQDLDDLYSNGSDRLKVYASTGLNVIIGAGTWRVGSAEWNYTGWTVAMTDNATNYVMIDSTGVIQVSTSAWNSDYARLAVVVTSAGALSSITLWRNDVVGGGLGGWASLIASGVYNTTATNATFTANAGTDVVTSNAHGLQDGDKIVLTTTGTLPAGLSLAQGYYARDVTTNTFKISSTPYRTAIDITDAGSGTHTWTFVRGSVKFTFAANTYLRMILRVYTPSVSSTLNVVLNEDADETALNYWHATQTDGAGGSSNGTFRWSNIMWWTNTANKYVDMKIENIATQRKISNWVSGTASVAAWTASADDVTQWFWVWDNSTDQITDILVHLDGTASFGTDSVFELYGSDSFPF